jgi:phage-related protein
VAVFDWVESPGTALEEEPRISRLAYGDGYEERAPAGLNPIRQRWALNFRSVERSVGDEIVAFLRACAHPTAGLEAFDWTPLWSTTAIRVTCERWSRSQTEVHGETDISATFVQVFEP